MAYKCSSVSVLGLLLVLALFHNPITVAGQSLPVAGLFPFGDSNFDAGNKQTFTTANVPQGFWPYGKSRDDPNGKFSDGRIAPDFLAKFMEIPIPIPAVLKPNVDISRGASFAVADATVLGAPVQSLTLTQQVKIFSDIKGNWTSDFIKNSVFIIYIGANDYLDFTKKNPDADASAQQAFVTSVISKLRNDISVLYAAGANKFVIQTLAPLGCLPIVRQDYKTGLDKCHEPLNTLAKLHNAKLGPMMNEMALAAPVGFQFTIFDFYNVILRRTQRPLNFRFFVTNSSCCGVGTHNAYGCGFPNVHSKLCEYQRSYLFFDGRHNTEKAQEMFGHLLFGADPTVIQPMTVRELYVYPPDEPMREIWVPTPSTATVQASHSSSSSSRGFEFY